MPRFCIVMPSYNSEETLGEALASALAQRHDDFAVVLTDNGSSDSSVAIAEAIDDPRLIRNLHADTIDKTHNWNRAYRDAPDCDYLVTLHADDRLKPDALRAIERASRNRPALVHGRVDILGWGGSVLRNTGFPLGYRASGARFRHLLVLWNLVAVPGATIRRDAFDAVGGWNPDYNSMQDVDMWWRLGGLGSVHYTARSLGDYRLREIATTPAFVGEYLRWHDERVADPDISAADRSAIRANVALFRHNLAAHPEVARAADVDPAQAERAAFAGFANPLLRQRLARLRLALTHPG